MYLDPSRVRRRGFSVGSFRVHGSEGRQRVSSVRSTNGEKTFGWCYVWDVSAPGGAFLRLGLTDLATGQRDVRPLFASGGNAAFARLNCGGLRLPLNLIPKSSNRHRGRYYVCLRQAQILPGLEQWSRLFDASRRSHSYYANYYAGGAVGSVLASLGAREVDTRENAYDEENRRRNLLCAVFDEHDVRVPIGTFLLTRAAPLLLGKKHKPKR